MNAKRATRTRNIILVLTVSALVWGILACSCGNLGGARDGGSLPTPTTWTGPGGNTPAPTRTLPPGITPTVTKTPPPGLTRPAAPANLRVTSVTASYVRLAWDDKSNNEDGFQVFQEGQSNPVAQTGPNETQVQIDNPPCGQTLNFRVRAFNSAGNSDYSNTVPAQTQPCGPTVPAAPTNLRVTSVTASYIRLAWDDKSNNEDGFQVFQEGQSNPAAQTGPNETQVQIDNPPCGQTLNFRVRAFNSAGNSSYSNIVEVKTAPCGPAMPTAPSDLILGTQTFNLSTFTLGCRDNSDNEDGFYLYVDGTRRATIPANPGKGTMTIWLSQLLPGAFQCNHTYQFQVSAFNAAGESARSNQYTYTVRCQ